MPNFEMKPKMFLEYLRDGVPESPVLRIYGENFDFVKVLREELLKLKVRKEGDILHVHQLVGIAGVGGCKFAIRKGFLNQGIRLVGSKLDFECCLDMESIETIADLIEPLTHHDALGTHQWLLGEEARFVSPFSQIGLVISMDKRGQW